MPKIKKVLNSSVILAQEGNDEYIVLQKGIGYGHKPGETFELEEESKIFIEQKEELKKLADLMSNIKSEYLEAASLITEYAEAFLGTKLNPHVIIALTDHLSFASDRIKDNLIVTNRLFWEIKSFYPREYRVGQYGLRVIKGLTGLQLPEEEAANIAFHIVNASQNENTDLDSAKATQFMNHVLSILTYSMQYAPDESDINYSRFVSHIQYFTQRFFADKMLDGAHGSIFEQIQDLYPKALEHAEKVRKWIVQEYEIIIPDEETAYIAIHVQRLISNQESVA